METLRFDTTLATYVGPAKPQVEKVRYSDQTGWLDKAETRGFTGVPEEVWKFQIGGYQVCNKWLKDRKKRKLSLDEIRTYPKIITALADTIRIQKNIDKLYRQAEKKIIEMK